MAVSKSIHQQTLNEYLRGKEIVPTSEYKEWHWEILNSSKQTVLSVGDAVINNKAETLEMPLQHPDYLFLAAQDDPEYFTTLIMIDKKSMSLIGGIAGATPHIVEEYQGKGLGKYLYLAIEHFEPFFINPVSYTEAGYSIVCSAHRFAVEQAISSGLDVPDEVLADYPELDGNQPAIESIRQTRM